MAGFRFPQPRSINAMVLIGYGCIMLPLVIALLWALFQLDSFTTRSQSLIVQGIDATQNSRKLQEQLNIMERVARQYQVSENAELIGFLREDSREVADAIVALRSQTANADAQQLLQRIDDNINQLLVGMVRQPFDADGAGRAISQFTRARDDADALQRLLNTDIDRQLAALQTDAEQTRTALLWQAIVLAAVSVVTMLFVTWRVSRPIRVLDRAINQLGEGQFSRSIEVHGPADLEALGHQLEWLRRRLLELAQEKNRFLRHMSHELKTPLANIREGTELLLDGSVGELDEPQEEVTDILRSNGIRLQRLIENLLNFSAWQSRNEVLACSEFPLRDVVESVLKGHALTLRSQQIRLLSNLEPMDVFADREMIRTVLDNLVSNALKFSPKGGCLWLRAAKGEDQFSIEVADQGPGIPMSERKKVFDAFYQGEQPQGGLVAGTGIGLSVVLECVQAHDGLVDISDEQHAVTTKRGDTVVFNGAHLRIIIPQQFAEREARRVVNG
ncbi:MAG: HAMP domain-containing sensor histidine kinase [Pseudomonadota bacterium]